MEFNDNTVLIVGACSRIGKAVASILIGRGYRKLVLADKDGEGLSDLETVLLKTKNDADILQVIVDANDADQIESMIETAAARHNELSLFVNCIVEPSRLASTMDLEPNEFNDLAHNSLRTTWICLKAQIRAALRQNEHKGQRELSGVSIVNVASCLGLATESATTAQAAVNHAIIGMMRSIALDYIDTGIRINCVCPGTPPSSLPSGQTLEFQEVANAVAFLLGPLASGINAVALPVDKGWSLYHL